LVGLLQRLAARVDVIEDAELHGAFPPPLSRIFGRPRRRRMLLCAKPSIAAPRRLSPSRGPRASGLAICLENPRKASLRRSERRRDGEERKRWIRATCTTKD